MKNFLATLTLGLLLCTTAHAQLTYVNSKYTLGYLATVLTGVYPTDSCVYVKGVMTDSLFRAGTFFGKVALDGQFLRTRELVDSTKEINSWLPKLIQNPVGNFMVAGYLFDPVPADFVAEFTPLGELIRFNQIRSPYLPDDNFIVVTAILNLDDNKYMITGNLNGAPQDIFLAKLDHDLQIE